MNPSSSPLTEPPNDSEHLSVDDFQTLLADARGGQPSPTATPRANRHQEHFPSSAGTSFIASSPVVGTKEERNAKIREKANKKRLATLRLRQEESEAQKAEERVHEAEKRLEDLVELFEMMQDMGLRFWDLQEYVFNPENKQGYIRWNDFFATPGNVTRVLNWWMSAGNRSRAAKAEIEEWIEGYVTQKVSREAREVTRSKTLQTVNRTVNSEFIKNFDFDDIHVSLGSELAPFTMKILESFATSRNVRTHTDRRKERTKLVITSAALACLGEYSHSNNLAKRVIGLYLYASGAQRQTITVLSTLGLSESYTNLVTRKFRRKKKAGKEQSLFKAGVSENNSAEAETETEPQRTGTLHQLSDSMRLETREIAAKQEFTVVYDNINMNDKNAEQIIGRHDAQENGTCSTLVPLFDSKSEDLDLDQFRKAFFNAPPLKFEDILHSNDERKTFKENILFTILRIIISNGGPEFKKFEKHLNEHQPASTRKIELHKTELHPLPSWNIDESSIVGNAEVDKAIVEELRLDMIPEDKRRVRLMAGDQLSIARLRALEFIRAGQEAGYEGFFWGAWIPGLFHAKIADAHGTLLNHFGKPDTGARNPGSLWFHNTRLDRLPITLTSLPTFRTCRDLIFVSLYARVLHCLLVVSGCKSLEDYTVQVKDDWDLLVMHASEVLAKYASTLVVQELRDNRADSLFGMNEGSKPTGGDVVFENAVLFLRDTLVSREFTDAIKAGDSGRVVLVLKFWALSFRGNGRTKYAYEMLHLIHNITNVWPKPLCDIIMKNWLINPTGLPNRYIELDIAQEHLNFWIKVAYKARGSNASWEFLETVSPCVDVLRKLAAKLNSTLGSDQGTRHAPPDLTNDIQALMSSLDEHDVYRVHQGRVIDDDDDCVKDVVGVGFKSLTDGTKNPLSEYNVAFEKLKRRRQMKPVSLDMLHNQPIVLPTPTNPPSSSTHSPRPSTIQESLSEDDDEDSGLSEIEDLDGGELVDILEDLERGIIDETLPRLSMDDVALDMDMVLIEGDDVEGDESDSDDDDGIGEELAAEEDENADEEGRYD